MPCHLDKRFLGDVKSETQGEVCCD